MPYAGIPVKPVYLSVQEVNLCFIGSNMEITLEETPSWNEYVCSVLAY